MSNDEYSLEDVVLSLDRIVEELELSNKSNSWNTSIGDELHEINELLKRIADNLEKIANK